jgi:predicted branched-subunit amino acid permease
MGEYRLKQFWSWGFLLRLVAIFCVLMLLDQFRLSHQTHAILSGIVIAVMLLIFSAYRSRQLSSRASRDASVNKNI